MEKGNVLVLGNSGVGKSTLINAVLGEECAAASFGTKGTTKELSIYENENVPFRVIDTVGFEPTLIKEHQAINAVQKWTKSSLQDENKQVNIIWFCIDGTAAKLFPKTIQNLSRAITAWRSVPIIVVITKSYSEPDRPRNIEMVREAFSKQKCRKNIKHIIPVVAATYTINETAYAAPDGITELIDATNDLLPEGIKAAQQDIAQFNLDRKRALAHGIVGVATAGAVVVGAVPIPFADASILAPLEFAEVSALSRLYGIDKDMNIKSIVKRIVQVGSVGTLAKTTISTLKGIPGINVTASVLNAVIAGSFAATLGEGSIYAFEQISSGKKDAADIDWIEQTIAEKFSPQFNEKIMTILNSITDKSDNSAIVNAVLSLFFPSEKAAQKGTENAQ